MLYDETSRLEWIREQVLPCKDDNYDIDCDDDDDDDNEDDDEEEEDDEDKPEVDGGVVGGEDDFHFLRFVVDLLLNTNWPFSCESLLSSWCWYWQCWQWWG